MSNTCAAQLCDFRCHFVWLGFFYSQDFFIDALTNGGSERMTSILQMAVSNSYSYMYENDLIFIES